MHLKITRKKENVRISYQLVSSILAQLSCYQPLRIHNFFPPDVSSPEPNSETFLNSQAHHFSFRAFLYFLSIFVDGYLDISRISSLKKKRFHKISNLINTNCANSGMWNAIN